MNDEIRRIAERFAHLNSKPKPLSPHDEIERRGLGDVLEGTFSPNHIIQLLDDQEKLRADNERLREALSLIETAATDFGAGIDENMERVRIAARAALEQKP